MNNQKMTVLLTLPLTLVFCSFPSLQAQEKPLVLQDMTWPDVQEYLKTSDMVIIPLGSTEQHGLHLPLGTDFYEALGMSNMISARTGVIVAPVVHIGHSVYHSGFPGTLSLTPETFGKVLFETAQMLIKYGFRRIMFFNYHGGNNVVQQNVVHRINHSTEATAVAIGHGGPIQKDDKGEFFDWHAGKSETSIMLYLKPELVRMERAQKPQIHFTPKMEQLRELSKKNPDLEHVWSSLFGVPEETKKGGASHELSSNGVWSFSDPKLGTKEQGQKEVEQMVETAVKFIKAWKEVKE